MQFTDQGLTNDIPRSARSPFARLIGRLLQVDLVTADASAIARILDENRIDEASLSRFINFVPDRYSRNGVYRNAGFELIVMCWPANIRSAIHEHGGSRGFVQVQRGTLEAENYTLVESDRKAGYARLSFDAKRTLTVGDIEIAVPGQDVHRVGSAGGESAVSLHLYARPLDKFFIFDELHQMCRSVKSRYDMDPLP
jgi:cysteine dioxygenase